MQLAQQRTDVTWSTAARKAPAGDTFVVNGNASAETYRIYTVAAATAAGITGLNADTEIVITRNGTNNASVIAELTRSRRSGSTASIQPAHPELPETTASRSSATSPAPSLNLNTITIDGDEGRRHGRHLGADLGAPDRVPLQRRQRHHRGQPAGRRT